MAEEILNTWEYPLDLLVELIAADGSPDRKVSRTASFSHDGGWKSFQMAFRLEDANGNEVAFPIRLISDTHIE